MKGLFYVGLTALMLTTAPAAMADLASSGPSPSVLAQTLPSESGLDRTRTAPLNAMVFNFTAPMITDSGVLGTTHFIRIAVIGMSLNDLMISLPSQMEKFDSVRIVDQMGKEVPAKTTLTKDRLAVLFNQPVTSGSYLQVEFNGVQMKTSGGNTLFYGVTAERSSLKGQIPIGTARIQVPDRG
jgi:hypothetical protein